MLFAGCSQQNAPPQGKVCAQVITYATSPNGECRQYPTPCDVPAGFSVVPSCTTPAADLCAGVSCENNCIGTTLYSYGTCSQGACSYASQTPNDPSCTRPEAQKYQFDSNLLFCEFDGLLKKYTLFYQIRNRTETPPTYRSTIWLKVSQLPDYGYVKTIQRSYAKDRVLWENQRYTAVNESFNGQFWEIRNQDTNSSLDYKLIFCEPEFSTKDKCTEENGIVIDSGNTADVCRIAGSPRP